MPRIRAIRERRIPLQAPIANAYISFSEMDTSLVAIVSDVIREGRPVVGYGFASNGRYSPAGILRDRVIPRVLRADPSELLDDDGGNFDPERVWAVAMRNEKPGGHGERSVAIGVLDMAIWDLAAKVAEVPLYRLLSDRYGDGAPDPRVFVYAAGGYYSPGRTIESLVEEMRGYLDLGYTSVKLKIGGEKLKVDLARIDAVVDAVGSAGNVAVDANGRFLSGTVFDYATALEPYGLMWLEEPGDPLDFEVLRELAMVYSNPIATGENLFSAVDARNLLLYGGLRRDTDVIQVDPSLSYGVVEYVRLLRELAIAGWSPKQCIPHGGHQLTLHMAAAFHLGGNESYPGVFEPIGGFGDDAKVEDGYIRVPDDPGIGIEGRSALYRLCRELSD